MLFPLAHSASFRMFLQSHQHSQRRQHDEGVGGTHGHALTVFHGLLLLPQRLAVGRNALGTRGGVLVLQDIPQAAQAFQQIAVGVGQGLPILAGGFVEIGRASCRERV